jgi:hypothetical protein
MDADALSWLPLFLFFLPGLVGNVLMFEEVGEITEVSAKGNALNDLLFRNITDQLKRTFLSFVFRFVGP